MDILAKVKSLVILGKYMAANFFDPFINEISPRGWGNDFASMRHFSKQTVDMAYAARQQHYRLRCDGKGMMAKS